MQAVSSRPDVTPPDYLKELEKLQDQIPAFDSKEAMQVMEQELGYPPSRLFSMLARTPTAAASLGQVSLSVVVLVCFCLYAAWHVYCTFFSQHLPESKALPACPYVHSCTPPDHAFWAWLISSCQQMQS